MAKQMNILIKQPYVNELLQDLADTDAIEILSDESKVAEEKIPEWQKEETRRRMAAFHQNPTDVYSWADVKKMLKEDEEM